MKKLLVILLSSLLLLSTVACGTKDETIVVGICQLAKHPALDAATQGFKDVLTEEFGDKVTIVEEIGSHNIKKIIILIKF